MAGVIPQALFAPITTRFLQRDVWDYLPASGVCDFLNKLQGSGFFIVIEGPDGGGKTTQVGRLALWLDQLQIQTTACRDPGGTALGDRLRDILLHREDIPIGVASEMMLFMAGRAQLVQEVIRPAMSRNHVVISDRFMLSNIVYQGYAGGLDVNSLWHIGSIATGGLTPDLTIVLDVTPEVASRRLGHVRDRLEQRPIEFHEKVRAGYLDAIKNYPAPFVLIDGSAEVDEVAMRIRDEVQRALGIGPRP